LNTHRSASLYAALLLIDGILKSDKSVIFSRTLVVFGFALHYANWSECACRKSLRSILPQKACNKALASR
jgi:hypothetical protein